MAAMRHMAGSSAEAQRGESQQIVRERWAGEISNHNMANADRDRTRISENVQLGSSVGERGLWAEKPQLLNTQEATARMNMHNDLPIEVVESPTSVNEAYLGSLKAMLVRNKGNYIVGTFLVGTQNLVSWEGVLYEVGNDYVTIYQPGRDRYIVCDMYSLKYMEFYDTQRRELCDRLLWEQGRF